MNLLYLNERQAPVAALREAIYNLNIDRMAEYACKNKKQTEYFLDVLSRPSSGVEEASCRAEVLRDFLKYPELLSGLSQIFRSYDNLRFETEEMTNEIFRYGVPAGASGMLDCTYEELYINAHFARNVIACFSEIFELFSDFDVSSKGLLAMKELCVSIKDSRCVEEVESAACAFRSESAENYKFTVKAELNEAMEGVRCTIAELHDISEKEKKKLTDIFKKKPIAETADIGSSAQENVSHALTAALSELSGIFADIANHLYSLFYGIGDELQFYSVACDMAKAIEAKGMNYCFPEVLPMESDTLSGKGLFDMLLLSEGKDSRSIIRNDLNLTTHGIIAMGDNNCGKTSFLRAVGSGVIFAQSGMFVCADSLSSSVRSGIFSHFSSAEKEFTVGDAAGRFEGEVMDIAKIIDALTPYSLVMLNESFQTTAYAEGAEGMCDILSVFPDIHVKYIFVTHMKAMAIRFSDQNVTHLRADKFVLKEV